MPMKVNVKELSVDISWTAQIMYSGWMKWRRQNDLKKLEEGWSKLLPPSSFSTERVIIFISLVIIIFENLIKKYGHLPRRMHLHEFFFAHILRNFLNARKSLHWSWANEGSDIAHISINNISLILYFKTALFLWTSQYLNSSLFLFVVVVVNIFIEYNSHTIPFTCFKYNSGVVYFQSYATTTTINYQIFSSCWKEAP